MSDYQNKVLQLAYQKAAIDSQHLLTFAEHLWVANTIRVAMTDLIHGAVEKNDERVRLGGIGLDSVIDGIIIVAGNEFSRRFKNMTTPNMN